MSDTCTFCPNEKWSYIEARDPRDTPPREAYEVPVCIDCLDNFEEHSERFE